MKTPAFVLAQRRSLFWRIHLWAALIASPFALVAVLTGLLYVFTPQIEGMLYEHLDTVRPMAARRPLDEVVQAAREAAPGGLELRSVNVPALAERSVQVFFSPRKPGAAAAVSAHAEHTGHAQHAGTAAAAQPVAATPAAPEPSQFGERLPRGVVVYVNPYTAEVLGSHAEMERFNLWARRLHSSLLQGDGWRWMIELAASWMMVMLLTGVYLWWPRRRARVLPDAQARGRGAWKQWHAFMGVALSVMSLAILTTGLTWSRHAGDQIRFARDFLGQASPSAPRGLQSVAAHGQPALDWQSVLAIAQRQAPHVATQMMPPRGAAGVWRLNNLDRGQALGRFNLVLDAYSGKTLFFAGWQEQTAFGKATAIGIPFHRGEFGWWNQALLFLFGTGVLFSVVSGWVMLLKRRRHGAALLPRLMAGAWTSMPLAGWAVGGVLCVALPLLAASAAVVVLVEALIDWRRRAAAPLLARS
ncbi:PepSY-associated TM helix domain-containing protein [Ramlibacter sp.]|uniref:PepSY-associated TM helix domain-containing protein n=1 Tax=Ramlibacter sp. TaxID=1917967 RepID=UPI002601E05B|nr:PepSY-associated TM helix domain-containing protein [Ramlibacter sp.]MDB5956770.1 hypothetical protein [Ramlibacter sp.]